MKHRDSQGNYTPCLALLEKANIADTFLVVGFTLTKQNYHQT